MSGGIFFVNVLSRIFWRVMALWRVINWAGTRPSACIAPPGRWRAHLRNYSSTLGDVEALSRFYTNLSYRVDYRDQLWTLTTARRARMRALLALTAGAHAAGVAATLQRWKSWPLLAEVPLSPFDSWWATFHLAGAGVARSAWCEL